MKIIKLQKSGKKYKIYLDNSHIITTYEEVILDNKLLYNMNIDTDLLNKINLDNNYYKSYYKILNMLNKKMRSEKEIQNYLIQNNIENADKIITKLKKLNLINDNNYLKAYITDQINLTNNGPYKIKANLLEHNIDETLIDEELSYIDHQIFINKVKKIINIKIKNNHKYSSFLLKQKIIQYLIQLGYDKNIIMTNLPLISTNKQLIEREYKKLYQRLSKKYRNEELDNKIKQQLLAKKFSYDEINQIKSE